MIQRLLIILTALNVLGGVRTMAQEFPVIDSLNQLSWNSINDNKLLAAQAQQEALSLSKDAGYLRGVMEALLNRGVINFSGSDYPGALNSLHEALDISRRDSASAYRQAVILNQISRVYIELGDPGNASDYLEQAMAINEARNDSSQLAGNYINAGIILMQQYDFENVFPYYTKALQMYRSIGDTTGMITALNNLGNYFAMNFQYTDERVHYLQALELSSSGSEVRAQVLYNIAQSFYAGGETREALNYSLEAYALSDSISYLDGLKLNSALLSQLYEEQGNNTKALQYFKAYKAHSDSLFNENTLKQITETELRSFYREKMRTDSLEQVQREFEKELAHQSELSTQRAWALAGSLGFILMLSLAGVLFRSNRQKQQANLVISQQKAEVEHQKHLVEEKNREVLDSITYARRLQEAILPPWPLVRSLLPDSFILYKPKDIVAGDFYWLEQTGNKVFFAAADCTGHGVPGAMVSVVCSNALNRAVKEFALREPGAILDKVRDLVVETFEKSENEVRDGMDISLCVYDRTAGTLKWAGANNPLWVIRQGEATMEELKADKQPVGRMDSMKSFTTHSLPFNKGDKLYIFTDGYADQFGGERGKKFKSANFRKLLLSIHEKPMAVQHDLLEHEIMSWKGDLEQVDDICVIGVAAG